MSDAHPEYNTKVFVDSNVILEARPLRELPWSDVDPAGPILVLVLPTVLEEVDRKKRDGRLAKRARDFNRLIAPLLDGSDTVSLVDGPLRVDLSVAHCCRVDWNVLDDLDREDGDHRVVAELLHVKGVPVHQRVMAGQDIKPLILAKRHGIRTIHVSEAWLPQPEASPLEKQVEKLKQQVRDYERNEPQFEAAIDIADPVSLIAVAPLTESECDAMIARILDRNPEPHQHVDRSMFSSPLTGFDHTLTDRYKKYSTKDLPDFVKRYSEKMELMFCQAPFQLRIENSGNLTADRAIIRVRVIGGWFNDKPIFVPANGPAAPRARRQFDPLRNMRVPTMPVRVGRHEFDIALPKREVGFEAHCEDFRHGHVWEFAGVVWLNPNFDGESRLIVDVTAANLHGKFSRVFQIQRAIQNVSVSDLVDEAGCYMREAAIKPLVDEYVERKEYSAIEIDGVDSEDD